MRIWSDEREAGFEAGRYEAYYGKDFRDEDTGDWMFRLTKGGRVVIALTNEELLRLGPSEETPLGMLMAGLVFYMGR